MLIISEGMIGYYLKISEHPRWNQNPPTFIVDTEEIIVACNPQAEKLLLEHQRQEICGQVFSDALNVSHENPVEKSIKAMNVCKRECLIGDNNQKAYVCCDPIWGQSGFEGVLVTVEPILPSAKDFFD